MPTYELIYREGNEKEAKISILETKVAHMEARVNGAKRSADERVGSVQKKYVNDCEHYLTFAGSLRRKVKQINSARRWQTSSACAMKLHRAGHVCRRS